MAYLLIISIEVSLEMAEKKIENMDSGQINPQFLQQDAFLKPKLDSIFAEVQASLPSIDFEVSDVS